jgi:hypothetical protein
MGRAGDLSFSGLWNYNSARVYSLLVRNQSTTAIQDAILQQAGYPDTPQQTVYFGDRGSEEFAGYGIVNASVNYNVPVFKALRPWIKLDLFNVFNNEKLIAWNTTVSQNRAAGVDNLGLATSFTKGANFGTATGNTVSNGFLSNISAYPLAFSGASPGGRTMRIAVGFRF